MESDVIFKVSDFMPIVTAGAALLGVYITNLAQEKRSKIEFENTTKLKERELKRSKLEEMHTLFQKWELDVSGLYIVFIPVFRGEYSAEDAMGMTTENRLQEKGDQQRFQTLMQLYFPELEQEFKFVFEERGKVLKFCDINGDFKRTRIKQFYKAQENFEAQTQVFKELMAQKIKEL
ncbi:TPA: hypothetical protein ACN361_002551 [Vibrio parahaemolyticus]